MDYEGFFNQELQGLKDEGRYRVFIDLERRQGDFPRAAHHSNEGVGDATVWCSNDYLGMGQHPAVLAAMHEAIDRCGAGAGGTRNISGTNHYHVLLEQRTGRPARQGSRPAVHLRLCLQLGGAGHPGVPKLPGCMVFSDEMNHASMIEGIRHSKARSGRSSGTTMSEHLDRAAGRRPSPVSGQAGGLRVASTPWTATSRRSPSSATSPTSTAP